MSQSTEELLSEIAARLKEGYQPQRIILFGSHAYGTPSDDSDVDLLVVKDNEETPSQRWLRVRRLLREANRRSAITPLVYTPGTGGQAEGQGFLHPWPRLKNWLPS